MGNVDDDHHHHHHTEDGELRPGDLSRRRFLQAAGFLGVAATTAGWSGRAAAAAGAAAPRGTAGGRAMGKGGGDTYEWSAGDHHIHTQYSGGFDAPYTIDQQVLHAARFGLGWVVITDHGGVNHQRFGVDQTYRDVALARAQNKGILVFQGLEWNPPAGDHSTVFVAPSAAGQADDLAVLKEFESLFDARVNSALGANTLANEAKAADAIRWLGRRVAEGKVTGALQILHHVSRSGAYAPRELRNLRDADPTVAIGLEGAPGHQAASIPTSRGGAGAGRGFYDNSPGSNSYPLYPAESYRTFGGFDWMAAKVGGVWDSMLAEGKPYWITATSDSHANYLDSWKHGAPNSAAAGGANGLYYDPVFTRAPITGRGDFWPGEYSRTHLGLAEASYGAVVDALRAGRIWVDHGKLVDRLSVTVKAGDTAGTLGETVRVGPNGKVEVVVRIASGTTPNFNGDVPRLRRVDLIAGPITGAVEDRDTMSAPGTQVVHSWELGSDQTEVELSYVFKKVDQPFYLRLRGTDGNFSAPGSIEPRQDPIGDVDPWTDLWFYTNPIFVER